MKYIRTKDGIYDFAKRFNLEHYKKVGFSDEDIVKKFIRNGNKIADTIEELCDGFIFKDTHANELHFLDINSGISLLGASLFAETLRGFIETDKGLIYVAKMNDKGELELL